MYLTPPVTNISDLLGGGLPKCCWSGQSIVAGLVKAMLLVKAVLLVSVVGLIRAMLLVKAVLLV